MRIAIDTGSIKGGDLLRGIGFHTQKLLEQFDKEKELNIDLVDTKKADLSKYDLVHYQKFHPFFISFPFRKRTKSVITIHDLIPLIYPQNYPPGIKGKLIFWLQKKFIKQMDAVITISETSKKDICRFLAIHPNKVAVTYLAPGENFKPITDQRLLTNIQNKYKLPNKFVLYVGDVNYNKNLLGLADACKIANIPLVIVGKQAADEKFDRNHPENKPFVEFLEKYGNYKNVFRLGYISDSELPVIFSLASVYCQPSFYEGFGLPIVQAFACGTPVVAARINCLVEVGENAALYADSKNINDLANKIVMIMEDKKLKNELVNNGFRRVKDFSWAKTAKQTLEVYKKVLNK